MYVQSAAARTLSAKQWNDRATKQRTQTQNTLQTYGRAVAEDRRIAHENAWERKTDAIIEKNSINQIAHNIRAGQKQKLSERRERLANMLAKEDEQYRQELRDLHESSHDRAVRLVNKARELKKEREGRRQQYVQEQYNRQWRESSDDLRTIESDKFAKHCYQEILQQRRDRTFQREVARQTEKHWDGVWANDIKQKNERAEAQIRDRKRYNHENKLQLLDQMQEMRYKREAQWLDAERERERFRKQLEEDDAEAQAKRAEKDRNKKALHSELVGFNDQVKAAREESLRKQKEEEKEELDFMLAEYQKELEERRIGRDNMIHEMHQYRAYLAERKAADKIVEAEMEQLVMEEMKRAQEKRDAMWMREKLAREQLMKDVFDGRQQQIRDKEEKRLIFEHEFAMERDAIEREIAKAQALEEQEAREAKLRALDHQRNLLRQIDQNNTDKYIARQQIEAEKVRGEEMERQYQAFLARERAAANSSPRPVYGRKAPAVIQN